MDSTLLTMSSRTINCKSRPMDIDRVKNTSPECLSKWFTDLKSMIDQYNVLHENIYNMEESEFVIGIIEESVTVINVKVRTRLRKANPRRQEWVTSIGSIYADGTASPPLIIFKTENLSHEWISADTPKG